MANLVSLSNEELLARLPLLRSKERKATAEVVVYLAEVDRRRLFLKSACSSLYSFCIERLGYSEDAAMKRMRVARLYQQFPQVLDDLESGAIHLTGLFLLASHLTADNADALLAETRGKTRREIERVLACWFPKSDVLPMVVPLGLEPGGLAATSGAIACPGTCETAACRGTGGAITCPETGKVVACTGNSGTGGAIACPETGGSGGTLTSRGVRRGPPARVQPLSAQSYRVEFTASTELHAKLEHAQALLSHAVAPGALPEIFERALDALIALETKRRQGVEHAKPRKKKEPKPDSRHVPVDVARAVWNRDGYQCTFVDELGRRCSAKRFLTLEHTDPHARGGPPTVENLCVLCDPHNQHAARREFGEAHIQRKQREAETYAKVARALVAQGFARKQANAALDTLRQRGAEPELQGLLRQALALLCQ